MRVKDAVKYNNIDPEYYEILAMVESSGNPNAQSGTSSAAGLFQFTEATWEGLTDQMGLEYTLQDRFDPEKSRRVVEEFTKRNSNYLKRIKGEEPTSSELYLGHLLGVGTAGKVLNSAYTTPFRSVEEVIPENALRANKSIFYNKDGTPKSVKDIYNWAAKKFSSPELQPYKEDKSIYGVDNQGNYITINPNTATKEQIMLSEVYKKGFYNQSFTNYDNTSKSGTFAEQNTKTDTAKKEKTKAGTSEKEKIDPWKQKLQQKINERKFLVDFINQGGIDYIAPERQSVNAVQRIQQSYMQDGGQIPEGYHRMPDGNLMKDSDHVGPIPVSQNGVFDFPKQKVLVPTQSGRITMKGVEYPILGISQETGQQILMQPNKEYFFPETKTVLEIPQL